MFPLGTVLVPGAPMPLHVFEPRYRALVEHCRDGVPEFGVVLIERGSEVGGGDVRFPVGTLARITHLAPSPDGRYLLTMVGLRRLRCLRWLPEDPFPCADVELPEDPPVGAEAHELRREAEARLRRLLALHTELGEIVPEIDVVLDPDPVIALYQAVVAAPLGVIDRYRILESDDPTVRLEHLVGILDDGVETARVRLATGDG